VLGFWRKPYWPRTQNIEDLSLLNLEDACLLPILQDLLANSKLLKLAYAQYFGREGTRGPLVEASLAIQRVLESSTTTCIRAFTLTLKEQDQHSVQKLACSIRERSGLPLHNRNNHNTTNPLSCSARRRDSRRQLNAVPFPSCKALCCLLDAICKCSSLLFKYYYKYMIA